MKIKNKDGKKHIKITFRVSESQIDKIDNMADEMGLTRSELARKFLLEQKIVIYDFSNLDELSAQIGKIGVNINQIARKLNQGGRLNKENAEFLITSIEVIKNALQSIYEDVMKNKRTHEEGG